MIEPIPKPDSRRGHPRDACEFLIRGLSRNLRNKFKAYCARRGVNMTDAFVHYMRWAVDQDGDYVAPPHLEGLEVIGQEDES